MVTVDEYARIRQAYFRDQVSIRALARLYHHSRKKVREIVSTPEPRPYTRQQGPPAPVLDPFKAIIDEILQGDVEAPPKQRHTAARIFRRLRQEHGYAGAYDRVRLYMKSQGRQQRETFIPLSHDPAQRLECDFGHIYVDFPDGRRQVPVLLAITSNLPFSEWVQVFQGERMTAALLDRLTHRCHIFEMNGESYRFRESMKGRRNKKEKSAEA